MPCHDPRDGMERAEYERHHKAIESITEGLFSAEPEDQGPWKGAYEEEVALHARASKEILEGSYPDGVGRHGCDKADGGMHEWEWVSPGGAPFKQCKFCGIGCP